MELRSKVEDLEKQIESYNKVIVEHLKDNPMSCVNTLVYYRDVKLRELKILKSEKF